MDIKPLADGTMIFAGTLPDMGRFGAGGNMIFYKSGEVLDFTNKDCVDHFTASGDSGRISFKPLGAEPLTFSITGRELKSASQIFKRYRDSHGAVKVTDWKDSYAPKLNGKKIEGLDDYETCRSVDIADDGTILLGADWSLYAFTSDGSQKWRAEVPGATWAVTIAADGRMAVALHDGGQIRWYRMSDGKMLLSLYIHPDQKRWILAAANGYYDAAPGADRLLGWHLNHGLDRAPDFFPVSQLAKKYYRPDVVEDVIAFADVDKALAHADELAQKKQSHLTLKQMLPPVVSILSPADNTSVSSSLVTVKYRIKNPSGAAITGVSALVDGRPITKRGLAVRQTEGGGEMDVPVPAKDCTVSVVALNRNGAGTPATIKLRRRGATEEFVIKPKLYILAIGVSRYADPKLKLDFAAKDAQDFAAAFKEQQGRFYRSVTPKVLTDKAATKDGILDGLDWILKETTDKDVAMVFLAGHGVNNHHGSYYYLPWRVETDRLRSTGLPYSEIVDVMGNIAGKALFFLDTCHSANVLGGPKRRNAEDTTAVINELAGAENGVTVFAAATGNQYSLEDPAWQNGAFTLALVEGINGGAAYQNKLKITVNMLSLYVSERVKELTGGRQTPVTANPDTMPDFPIALRP